MTNPMVALQDVPQQGAPNLEPSGMQASAPQPLKQLTFNQVSRFGQRSLAVH